MSNLLEFHNLIQEEFPKVESNKIYKILFSIQARLKKHTQIGLSRYEYDKFWVSQKTLRNIIEYLRDFWVLEFSHSTLSTNKKRVINKDFQKCNVYNVSESFQEMILSFQRFIKKTFEYIDPIVFMKRYFKYIEKRTFYKFKHNSRTFIISKKWRFQWVILDTQDMRIVSPLSLL